MARRRCATFSKIIPLLRPTLVTVLTLGLIGTWQVFDQIYIMSKGAPGKTTLTPAFLAYDSSINNRQWGQGTAMSFVLFALIIVLTLLQTFVLRDRDGVRPCARLSRTTGEVTDRRRAHLVEVKADTAPVVAAPAPHSTRRPSSRAPATRSWSSSPWSTSSRSSSRSAPASRPTRTRPTAR